MLNMVTISMPVFPKVRATPKAPIAIPMEPLMSNGFLPHFSTVKTATKVKRILTTPIMTVCTIGLSIPISPKMRGA